MQNERLARAALSRLMEPQHVTGLALVSAAGAECRFDELGLRQALQRLRQVFLRQTVEFGERLRRDITPLRKTGEDRAAVQRPFDLAFQDHDRFPLNKDNSYPYLALL